VIRRLRAALPLLISLGLLVGASGALVAQATQAVTRAEMESYVMTMLAAGGGAMAGAFWLLLTTFNSRLERAFDAGIKRLEENQARYFDALRLHDESEHAHAAASEHNHGPMQEQLDRLETQVGAILRDCESRQCGARGQG